MQTQRGLAGRFRAVDFDHPAARQAADTERDVQTERASRHGLDILADVALAHLHHGALAELLFDLGQRRLQRLALVLVHECRP
jgi:hypothetical protein